MNLQLAKEQISAIGRWLAEEATVADNRGVDYEEPVMGCILVKRALLRMEKQEADERFKQLERQFKEERARVMWGNGMPQPVQHVTFKPDNPRDSGEVSAGGGVEVGDSGTGSMPGQTQTHNEVT